MSKTKVKICCIGSVEEATQAIESGASAIGLVGPMPSGPGIIGDDLIRDIAAQIPSGISTFLLTSNTTAADIIAHHQKVNTTTIQIVDAIASSEYEKLREALPAVKLVQVIHVIDEYSVKEAMEVSSFVDFILLDSGNPAAAVKMLGGTGNTHNWKLSREIREAVNVPVILAGGLHSGNVQEAIETVQPFGVDVCSGVRTNGQLDAAKLNAFFEAVG